MQQVEHVYAYWLSRCRSIPGGASASVQADRIKYWRYVANLLNYRILSGRAW